MGRTTDGQRAEHRSGRWKSRLAKVALVAGLLGVSVVGSPGTAHAATFHTCGHQVVTSYNQGWVVLEFVTDASSRPDIQVAGYARGVNNDWVWKERTAWNAVLERVQWANNSSFIYIGNKQTCRVLLH